MKIILVTGGNRGIGLEICRQLDLAGYSVIMGSRDVEKGRKAAEINSIRADILRLDITDEESMHQAFRSIMEKYGKLDVLINNAGIGASYRQENKSMLTKARKIVETGFPSMAPFSRVLVRLMRRSGVLSRRKTASDISMIYVKEIMETNFYGAWRMSQVFLPLLKKSAGGHIINISSGMGELSSLNGDYPAYRISKASLNALTIMLAHELRPKGINVNAMCPGWVRTEMGGLNAPRSVNEGADTAVWLATVESVPTGKLFRDRKEISW